MRKLKIEQIMPLIRLAIEEDLGSGDITSELVVKKDTIDRTDIITREEIFVAGMDVAREILHCYDENLKLTIAIPDGKPAHVGARLGTIEGPYRAMLSAERVLLNFLIVFLLDIRYTQQEEFYNYQTQKAKLFDFCFCFYFLLSTFYF